MTDDTLHFSNEEIDAEIRRLSQAELLAAKTLNMSARDWARRCLAQAYRDKSKRENWNSQ